MKKGLIILGSLLGVGALAAAFVYNHVPAISVERIDWKNRTVDISVRGNTISLEANTGSASGVAGLKFSKYGLTFKPNQSNSNDIWVLYVSTGNDIEVGQPLYFDFKKGIQL